MCLANAAYVKTKLKMNCHEHNQIEHQELSVYQGLFKRKVRCSEKKNTRGIIAERVGGSRFARLGLGLFLLPRLEIPH